MAYIGKSPEIDAVVNKLEYVATAGQTVFIANHQNAVDVYVNGIRLVRGLDYTLSAGLVTISNGLNTGDTVSIDMYSTYQIADHYTIQEIDDKIGTEIQAYDADTTKNDVSNTFTASQRGVVTTDNDLSFDLNTTNFFKCTPTATGTLTFTNIPVGQSGTIILDNTGGYVISCASTTYISANDLTTINTAGRYKIGYISDGTNVYCSVSQALTSAGA